MRIALCFLTLAVFSSSHAWAGDILTGRDLKLDELGKCRRDFSVRLCRERPDLYKCVMFHKGNKPYLTWEELFGNGSAKTELQRLNRRNTIVWRNHCLAMPFRFDRAVPPFLFTDSRYQERTVVVDLKGLAWAAYERGSLVRWGAANGGSKICHETGRPECKTPVGTWRVYEIKKGFARSSLYPVDCSDKKKCGHPYYNVMKFGPHFEALHGERVGHVPGANVSHGCVRMFREDSDFLVNRFVGIGTTVVVLEY